MGELEPLSGMDYAVVIDSIRDQRLDYVEMLADTRKKMNDTLIDLLLTSPEMLTSRNAVLVFEEYLKVKDEIVAVLNNLDIVEDKATALMSSED